MRFYRNQNNIVSLDSIRRSTCLILHIANTLVQAVCLCIQIIVLSFSTYTHDYIIEYSVCK
jgi:hypothetical protein